MMKRDPWWFGGVLVVAVALLACKKTDPEAVCTHMRDLAKKAGKVDSEAKANDQFADCVGDVTKIRGELGDEKYKKFAACVLEKDDFDAARKQCDPDSMK